MDCLSKALYVCTVFPYRILCVLLFSCNSKMSEESFSSPASRHDSRVELPGSGGGKDGPPPPFTPAAQRSPPLDDVIHTSAGKKRTLSPGREVARSSPLTGPSSPAYLGSGEGRRRSPHRRRRRDDGQTTLRRRVDDDETTLRRRGDYDEATFSSRRR